MQSYPESLIKLAADIRLVAIDVDGVLTDGRLYYSEKGEELKVFHTHDGFGLKKLAAAGVEPVIISARNSQAVRRRMKELGIARVHLGAKDKGLIVDQVLQELKLQASQLAAIGDDMVDLPMLQRAALAVAVDNAHADLKMAADWVTTKTGGAGAVRELCDLILCARGS